MHTVEDVAKLLNVAKSTVYSLVESGKLRCYRIGRGRGTVRISEEHLRQYLADCESSEAEEPRKAPRRTPLKHLRL